MCGIFGYIGKRNALETCVAGLEQLEYRGYDSTGIAGVSKGKIAVCKEAGKLSNLKKRICLQGLVSDCKNSCADLPVEQSAERDSNLPQVAEPEHKAQRDKDGPKMSTDFCNQTLDLAIGHTRWATHGKVTHENAHPHIDDGQTVALVHNGIIENYDSLKEELPGVHFKSETDSEIIAQLIAKHYAGCLVHAVQKTLPLLKGHFAFAVIHKNHPDLIVAATRDCPLSVGTDDSHSESLISSDPNAFLGAAFNILFLRNDEVAKVQKGKIEILDKAGKIIAKKTERLDGQIKPPSKEGFEHFMLKEIFEQPITIQKAIFGRIEGGKVQFESLPDSFRKARHVWLVGCGTSWHAACIGTLFLEDLAGISAHAEISSEARFRIIPRDALVIAISQSGETADTISAVREIKKRGNQVLGICNVNNSTLTRETNGSLSLNAGPEMSVCSTKAFTSQIAVLYLFACYMANRKIDEALHQIPEQVSQVLKMAHEIEKMAKKYSHYNDFFFMGRRYMFPTCLEAALKLKEISYLNANGYPAGELKHGPIALIDDHFPVIAFCANHQTEEKIVSNLQEVKARGAPVLALVPENLKAVSKIADDIIWLPDTSDELAPFASSVAGQLLAYYIAKERGCDIDQPRNLAKSVTVE